MIRPIVVVAFATVSAAIGLGISFLIAAPLGADHSCPAGATPSQCRYPPNQTSWSVLWMIAGLVVGLCIGLVAARALRRRSQTQTSVNQ
jgi:hypothetical protein